MSSRESARKDSYEDLLAQLESLAPDGAESILASLASALFPSGSGQLRQVSWEGRADREPPAGLAQDRTVAQTNETKLRAAELRYRTLVEQIPAVTFMAVLGEGENEVYVSPHIETLLGFTQKEWLENPFLWYTQLHSDDRALWHEEFARGCRTGGPFRAECRFLARDGRVVWVRGEARLVKDELGRPLFLQGVAFDITETKRAQASVLQEAVRTTEERYRDLVERLGAIFWEADAATGGFTFVSRGSQDILGVPPERWVGEATFWLSLVHPDDRDQTQRVWEQTLRRRADAEFEFRAIAANHRVAWLAMKVHFPAADTARSVGVVFDITDRKRSEEQLAHALSAEQLARGEAEALNRVGRSLAAELDLEGLVKQITAAGAQLTGAGWAAFIPAAEDLPRQVYARVADDRVQAQLAGLSFEDPLLAPTFAGSTILIEDLVQHFQGALDSRLPTELAVRSYLAVPVISRAGAVLGGILCGHSRAGQFTKDHQRIVEAFAVQTAIAVDNAQLYRATENARKTAESANRAKDEFLATMSHELRTPLNAVLGWIQILRSGAPSDATRERALATIDRNARAQAQIIDDLLDVSRIVTGKLLLNVEPVDLSAVIDGALDSITLAATAKQIALVKDLDRSAANVYGDVDRLRQVISNLLTNAVKFTAHRGRIEVRLDAHDGAARVRVTDNGQGIDPGFLPHVFDRFRQADSSTTRTHGGLGLGLAIVRHLVEMHGGSIHAESAGLGRGATFTVELPLDARAARQHDAGGRPVEPESEESSARLTALKRALVLVVDDEPDSLELVTNILTTAGADVAPASSAADALRSMVNFVPALVICDIGMPETDGFEMIRQLRALDGARGHVPALALTAYAREEDRRRALAAGFQAHMAKPFDAEQLLGVAADLIRVGRQAGPEQ